jgi:hypothetical protein
VLIIMGLQLLQPLATYAPYLRLKSTDSRIAVPIVLLLAPVGLCALLVDSRFGGRRVLLLASSISLGLCKILPDPSHDPSGVPKMLQSGAALLAWGPVLWIYTAEVFTREERRWTIPLLVLTWHAVQFMSHDFLTKWQVAAVQDLDSSETALGVIFVLLFVRETRCWPLEDMPALFSFKDRLPLPSFDAARARSASCISSNKSFLALTPGQNSPMSRSRQASKVLLCVDETCADKGGA